MDSGGAVAQVRILQLDRNLSRKSDAIFGQGTILEPSMPHIGPRKGSSGPSGSVSGILA
jgi:hypothetical protein